MGGGHSRFGLRSSCSPGNQDGGHHNHVGASSGRHANALVRAVFYFNWRPREGRQYSGCSPRFRPWEGPVPGPRIAAERLESGRAAGTCKPCPAILPHASPAAKRSLSPPLLGLRPDVRLAVPRSPERPPSPWIPRTAPARRPPTANTPRAQTSHPGYPRLRPLERLARTRGTLARSPAVWSPPHQMRLWF